MVGGLSLFIYFLCVLQTNNGLEERCLRKEEKDFQEYKQNIPELRDIDFQDHGFSTRHLSIISMEADPSSQLMGWIIHTLVTEYLNYPDAQHLVSQKADLFNNVPSKELSISTNLWHSSTSINSLPPNAEVVQPAFLTGRFNFFLPSWILQRSKFKVSDLTINCSLPLHHHPLSTFFDHSQLHTAVLEFLKSKNTAFSNLSALQGFHSFDTWAVYRSQGCLSDLHACVVIVASNYQSYGKCLVEMVERTHSKVVVFWLGHQWMHQFVMGRNSGRKSVFYFGSNLDTLYTSGLFEHLPVQQWSCLSGECTWSYHPIHNALTRDLVNSAYLIDNLMRRIKMSQEHMDHMLNHNYWSRGAKQVACDWLKENKEVWSSWLKEAPNKQPVPIMIFYPLEHALPILLMATMAVRRINANSSILPNHHLILLDSQIGALSSPSQYKYVIESLSSGQVKAAFGSIRQSLSRLPDLMDAYKTIFFSFSSPVDFLDTGHTDTYFTMVGAFMPKDNQAEEQLQLDKSLFKWSTPDGKMPSDLIALVEQEACNLQVVSDLFHVSCNQAIAIFSIFVTLLIILPILFIIIAFRKRFYGQTIVEPIISQRLREKWEMKRENIKINRVLGHGEFGTVFGGEVSTGGVGDKVVAVAIKILKSGTRSEDKLSFFVEADLMKDFEHENIMKLVGVCSIDEPPMVVMEFMMYGDLRTFLLSRRHRVSNRGGSVELGPQAITKMALDVAKGLEYLSRNFCVHRDLACRNILVHESGVVKISDFGLSQKIYDECYTKYVNDNKIPIRWMAPECLNHGVFSFASDIWSYGVLVYEIFTFGTIPYHNLSNEKVVHHIKEGGTIHIPQNCPEDLANMLKRCWAYEAEDRPSIQVLIDELTSKPLLLKPCLDLPIPQLDPKDASTSAKANFKNLFPRQWASRLSTSSTTGLLVRYRNTFARTGSVQSPDRSPDAAHRVSEERFFNYPSNVASRDVSTAVESRSEAGLDEAEERFLLKRIGVKRAFVRSVSSEHKTPRFKVFKRKKASSELFREKP